MTASPESKLVLGTWGLAGPHGPPGRAMGYGAVDDAAFDVVCDAAWAAGLRWVDTAPSYGAGEGYRRLASWQRSRRQSFAVVIKPGRPLVDGVPRSVVERDALLAEIEVAQELLGPAAAILLKDPPAQLFHDGGLDRLLSWLEGTFPRVRCGFATHLPAAVIGLGETAARRVAQIEYSGVCYPDAVPAVAHLAARGYAVWAMQPLALGFLAREDGAARSFGADDFRGRLPAPAVTGLSVTARAFHDRLRAFASSAGAARRALAFCLADPLVERTVVGPRTESQLRDALAAIALAEDPEFGAACAAMRRGVAADD